MSSDRLNRKVFAWADCISISNKCVQNWNFKIKKTFCELNVGHFGDIVDSLDIYIFLGLFLFLLLKKLMEIFIHIILKLRKFV